MDSSFSPALETRIQSFLDQYIPGEQRVARLELSTLLVAAQIEKCEHIHSIL